MQNFVNIDDNDSFLIINDKLDQHRTNHNKQIT